MRGFYQHVFERSRKEKDLLDVVSRESLREMTGGETEGIRRGEGEEREGGGADAG